MVLSEIRRGKKDIRLVNSVRHVVENECNRLKPLFEKLSPLGMGTLNAYHIPKINPSLISFLNEKYTFILDNFDEEAEATIRHAASADRAYERIFTNKFFNSMVYINGEFKSYFDPIRKMCGWANVDVYPSKLTGYQDR